MWMPKIHDWQNRFFGKNYFIGLLNTHSLTVWQHSAKTSVSALPPWKFAIEQNYSPVPSTLHLQKQLSKTSLCARFEVFVAKTIATTMRMRRRKKGVLVFWDMTPCLYTLTPFVISCVSKWSFGRTFSQQNSTLVPSFSLSSLLHVQLLLASKDSVRYYRLTCINGQVVFYDIFFKSYSL
jgi:hypothetical protein